jgi:hypothetical protein
MLKHLLASLKQRARDAQHFTGIIKIIAAPHQDGQEHRAVAAIRLSIMFNGAAVAVERMMLEAISRSDGACGLIQLGTPSKASIPLEKPRQILGRGSRS